MSRRSPRVRAKLTASVRVTDEDRLFACPTRDVSRHGCCLMTAEELPRGARLSVAVMDTDTGQAVEATGIVARTQSDPGPGLGVELPEAPEAWIQLTERYRASAPPRRTVRLRILVVGDLERQRGALALYVTSGWDIRFASDLDGATQALKDLTLNAVVAEHDLDDSRWPAVLSAARRLQPRARRIVRGRLPEGSHPRSGTRYDLVHRVVDRALGLDALVDALTADLGSGLGGPTS